jgi:hypothetical protein
MNEESRIEEQELWCHACRHYVQFELDLMVNGNHVLECPNCGHEHCRVVTDGVITAIRWDRRNPPLGNIVPAYSTGFTITSMDSTSASTSFFISYTASTGA